MKIIVKIFLGVCLIVAQISFGQIRPIINPSYSSKDISNCEIVKIERTSYNTTVYFKYKASEDYTNGEWICASGQFFIRDTYSKLKYKLIKANDIPICPTKYHFQYKGQLLEFNIVFEALPNSTIKIDIIEDEINRGFNFIGVNLNTATYNNFNNSPDNKSSALINDCDNIVNIPKSNKPDFKTMLTGVKYVVILSNPKINGHIPAFNALYEYLQGMGFEIVEYFDDNYEPPQNACEELTCEIYFDYDLDQFYNISMVFQNHATGYSWSFHTNMIAKAGLYSDPKYNFGQALRNMYGFSKGTFNSYYTMKLAKKQTCWTETKIKTYMQSIGCDKIEGIYEDTGNSESESKYKVAVRKINGTYYLIYLSGANNIGNWAEGEIKATLEPTATPLLFKARWIMGDKVEDNNYYITFEQGFFNLLSEDNDKDLYVKMFPSSNDNFNNVPSQLTSSGTGYAISSNGYIVTNYHVTNGATSIKIRGINGDFSKTYKAIIIIEDKNNDLSILKINDPTFISLGVIPYIISNRTSDVGSSVFVLGYPLRATMGDEVKLTNGIISSKSGFQGDVTSYQISAPIQPGNSGGPLFDDKGYVIGIINAKHTGAENASYAIKSSYLINLIDLIPTPPKLQTISIVASKPLTEQVKILKKFTYIIEIN
jgi:S1-C subfamily serine protease